MVEVALVIGSVAGSKHVGCFHADADAVLAAGEAAGVNGRAIFQKDIVTNVVFHLNITLHSDRAVVPDAGSVGVAGVVGDGAT